MTEDSLAEIAKWRTLKTLHLLDAAHFEDAWIPHLLQLKGLTDLALRSRFLTDKHVEALGGLKDPLVSLDLQTAGITDACLDDLAGFKHLTNINLTETGISDAGIQALCTKLPGFNIIR